MFTLTNNKNSRFQIVFTVVITAIALLTLGMAKFSSAPADKSYDAVERLHASRSLSVAPKLAAYDQLENVRAERALGLTADPYKAVEQLRTARGLSADRSYDAVENVRSIWNNTFSASVFGYDQIETMRTFRDVPSITANSGYELIEQLRNGRGIDADHSYDQIETLRLGR